MLDHDGHEALDGAEARAARDLDTAEKMRAMRARRQMSDSEIFQARKAFPRLAPANGDVWVPLSRALNAGEILSEMRQRR